MRFGLAGKIPSAAVAENDKGPDFATCSGMKRFLIVCVLAVCALPLPAQEDEGLFTIERTFPIPGISAYDMRIRADSWFYRNTGVSSMDMYRFDENMHLDAYGQSGIVRYVGVDIQSMGKTYRCYLTLYTDVMFDKGFCTVKVSDISVNGWKKRGICRLILDGSMKADESQAYDTFVRKKKMRALSRDIKVFVAAEFEKIFSSLEAAIKKDEPVFFIFQEEK